MKELLTPQQIHARLVASYLFSFAAQGRHVDVAQIERDARAELELVDAARRQGELDGGGTKDPSPSSPRPDILAAAQAGTGTTLRIERGDIDVEPDKPHQYKPNVLHRNPMERSARWGAAVARIGRILEGASGSTLTAAAAAAQCPALARKWVEIYGYYMTRAMPPPATRADHNPFRGLSDRDAARSFMRAVEDLCDQSSGVLGSWYVK